MSTSSNKFKLFDFQKLHNNMKVNSELKKGTSRTISWLVIYLEIFYEYYIQRKCKRVKRWWIILISWTILHSTVATFGLFSRTTFEYKSHLLLMAADWAVHFFLLLFFCLLIIKSVQKTSHPSCLLLIPPSTANISPVVEEEGKKHFLSQ